MINCEYIATPTRVHLVNGIEIPQFFEEDPYTSNYAQISEVHVEHLAASGVNPFMEENYWAACEDGTRQLIEQFTAKGDSVLDVGCGLGRLISPLTDRTLFGCDISLAYLSKVAGSNIKVCLARVEELPYQREMFDCVVCTDVLEHVFSLTAAVSELERVLRSDGTLIIRVPLDENLSPYLSPDYPFEYAHLRSFSLLGLQLIFSKVFKFEVLSINFGPAIPSSPYLKVLPKIPLFGFLIRSFIRPFKKFSPVVYGSLLGFFFSPVEVNVVLRKNEN